MSPKDNGSAAFNGGTKAPKVKKHHFLRSVGKFARNTSLFGLGVAGIFAFIGKEGADSQPAPRIDGTGTGAGGGVGTSQAITQTQHGDAGPIYGDSIQIRTDQPVRGAGVTAVPFTKGKTIAGSIAISDGSTISVNANDGTTNPTLTMRQLKVDIDGTNQIVGVPDPNSASTSPVVSITAGDIKCGPLSNGQHAVNMEIDTGIENASNTSGVFKGSVTITSTDGKCDFGL